jgi:glycosyltransferase involved in cell wall biosynthesis
MGGAERILRIVALELAARNYEVDILCLSRGTGAIFSKMQEPRCNIYILSESREVNGVFKAIWLCLRKLSWRRYHLAFSSLTHCNAFVGALRLVGLLRIDRAVCRESTVISKRFFGFKRFYYWCCYLFYAFMDAVICQTREMKQLLVAFNRFVDARKLHVVNNPIAITDIQRMPPRDTGNEPSFVAVGRLIKEKGFDSLIAAFDIVQRKYPGARLDIYGDGYMRTLLEQEIEKLGLQDKVTLRGNTSTPAQVMRDADVCVVSSLTEGFPNTLLEMMQVNTRIVATLCADGVADIQGLITCPPGDPAALASAMSLAIVANVDKCGAQFDAELARRDPASFVDSIFQFNQTV